MKLPSFFRRTTSASAAARAMRKAGVDKQRALIRATADDMRARLGMPEAEWPQ